MSATVTPFPSVAPAPPPAPRSPRRGLGLRSALNTCGLNARQFEKAASCGADLAVLDLEDAVAAHRKAEARRAVVDFLAARPAFPYAVRINELCSEEGLRDLAELLASGAAPAALFLPKVESPEEVRICEAIVARRWPGAALLAIVETAAGVCAAEAIAAATPRLAGLIFGAADFAAHHGLALERESLRETRARVALAAARARVQAIDAPCFEIYDGEILRAEAESARDLGFSGKIAIHPRQIATIHRCFGQGSTAP